jgi:hypothetical protein
MVAPAQNETAFNLIGHDFEKFLKHKSHDRFSVLD